MSKNKLNKEQQQFLGMPVSTARSQLCKKLLYLFVAKAKENICHRCWKEITSAEDFTIEHKEDWRYKPEASSLFFDYDNIAFSHSRCNSQFTGGKRRIASVTGYKGVTLCAWRKSPKKYKAQVFWRRRKLYMGYFATAEEAALAYDLKAKEIQGDKAVTNKELGKI